MRKLLLVIAVLVVFSNNLLAPPQSYELCKMEQELTLELIEIESTKLKIEQMNEFLTHIGMFESGNNYDTTNTLGYMGRFQFGKSTLRNLGFTVTKKEFLKNPTLQDLAMQSLLKHNKEKLQKYIDYWDGKYINGQLVTESGILAAAHLAGQGNVKRYFNRGTLVKDVYGTSITRYLFELSGYELSFN